MFHRQRHWYCSRWCYQGQDALEHHEGELARKRDHLRTAKPFPSHCWLPASLKNGSNNQFNRDVHENLDKNLFNQTPEHDSSSLL
jgi:hypothetical protein